MFTKTELKPQSTKVPSDHAATRVVRQLVNSPASLYLWLSGPAMTARDRTRAEVADFSNSWAGTLLGK